MSQSKRKKSRGSPAPRAPADASSDQSSLARERPRSPVSTGAGTGARAIASTSASAKEARRWPKWLFALAVFAATCFVFRSALDGAWLDWDDAPLLLENQTWHGLSTGHLTWMLTTFHMGPYQPLSWVSCAIDHAL